MSQTNYAAQGNQAVSEFETMVQNAADPLSPARYQEREDNDQMAYNAQWLREHPRKTTRRDVRDFIGALLVLAICGAAVWAFMEWQALGGWAH